MRPNRIAVLQRGHNILCATDPIAIDPVAALTAEVKQVVVLAPPAVREVPHSKQDGTEACVQLVEALR